ncbi:MAG: hypothetical protein NTZ67_01855 [Gammaproteobacteria bacterium]|nr:hypothetical protein [Gammaproteobacteria bacterium]
MPTGNDSSKSFVLIDPDAVDFTSPSNAEYIAGGDQLRNINSYAYLLAIAEEIFKSGEEHKEAIENLKSYNLLIRFQAHNKINDKFEYDHEMAYGDFYTLFINALERDCENKLFEKNEMLTQIVRAAYLNDNKALERAAIMNARTIENVVHTEKKGAEKKITKNLNKGEKKVNEITPQDTNFAKNKLKSIAVNIVVEATKDKPRSKLGELSRHFAKSGKYDFKPMSTTSLVSIRKYTNTHFGEAVELRKGTQAQYHQGKPRVAPTYLRKVNDNKDVNNPDKITDLYINNLGRDRFAASDKLADKKDIHERIFESRLTAVLETAEIGCIFQIISGPLNELEKLQVADGRKIIFEKVQNSWFVHFSDEEGVLQRKPIAAFTDVGGPGITVLNKLNNETLPVTVVGSDRDILKTVTLSFCNGLIIPDARSNLAVITLPADHGLMDKKFVTRLSEKADAKAAFQEMFDIVNGAGKVPVQDFYISEKVEKLLYGVNGDDSLDAASKEEEITDLLNASFKKILGIDNPMRSDKKLSQAEQQAVYFHFMKYELSNFIIEKIKPKEFNMSCKDGIDRGGVSSAYCHLIKSIELNMPISNAEFDRALHASATNIKGRGVNNNSLLIWNAINGYIEGFQKQGRELAREPSAKNNVTAISGIPAWLVEWRNKNAPKNTKRYFMNELESYARGRENLNQHAFFARKDGLTDKVIKLSVTKKLLALLESGTVLEFSKEERKALEDGKLGKLHKDIMKGMGLSLYTKDYFIKKLEAYKAVRNNPEKEGINEFQGINSFPGKSKKEKILAVDLIINYLKVGERPVLSLMQWCALNDGRLGKIIKEMKKMGIDLSELKPIPHEKQHSTGNFCF